MRYRVTLTPATEKTVGRFPKSVRSRIADRLAQLADNPRPPGSIKLAGEDAYRVRVGDYRIIYTIHDDYLLILGIDIGHRGEVYRRR